MDKRVRKILLLVLGIGIMACLALGISSAFLKPVNSGTSVTEMQLTSCAKVMLLEKSNAIRISNTAPMSDQLGLQQTPYEFSIKSSCDSSVNYKIYLAILSDSTLDAQKVKYAIKDKDKNEVVVTGIVGSQTNAISDFDTAEQKQLSQGINGTASSILTIMDNNILANTEKTYQLYLWVDKNSGNEVMNQTFTAGVAAKSFDEIGD